MKYYILLFIAFVTINVKGQTKKEIKQALEKINSKTELDNFKTNHSSLNLETIEIDINDFKLPQKLIKDNTRKTKLVKIGNDKYYYKLIDESIDKEFRASYIYLNGRELSKRKIDSIRPIIIKKYETGISFADLVEEYNMDGNSKKGDLGWFKKGTMVSEFEKAVIEHKKSDIFTVDVESKKWYYVVLKTHDDKKSEKRTYIRIKSSS